MSKILTGITFQYKDDFMTESVLLLEQQRTYKLWESAGNKLVEAQLTADQISQLFTNIEQSSTAAGTNRTGLGKAKDATTAVNNAWKDLKTKISNSGPVKGFDQKVSDVLSKIGMGASDPEFNGQVTGWVKKYRDFANKYPMAQQAILGTLIAIAGITGAGVGGAAAIGLLRTADQLIQGKRFSSAAYSGAKAGAAAYAAGKIGDFAKDKLGGGASDAIDAAQTSGDAAKVGKAVKASGKVAKTAARTFKPKMEYVNGELIDITQTPGFKNIMAKYPNGGKGAYELALKMGAHQARGGTISEATIALIFTRIDEGLWDTIKGKAAQVGKNLTTKVTADKLMSAWKKAGSPTDHIELWKLLVANNVPETLIKSTFSSMGIGGKKKAASQVGAQPAQAEPAATTQPAQAKPAQSKPQMTISYRGQNLNTQNNLYPQMKKDQEEKEQDWDRQASGANESKDTADFQNKIKNIVTMNPKGSAAEQILLGKFLGSDQGAYARNVLGKNHKGWIEHITTWLKKNQPRLEKEFNELDFSDLTSLAYDMYENYLAKQGQLEEASKAEIRANLDQDIKDFLAKGGEIEKLKPNKVRAIPGMGLASKHIGTAGEINRKTRSKMLVGKGRNVHGTKPVVNVEEGEVVSMQARKTPLVVAGHPFDWNVYDLRNNKMVASVIGGDRSDSKLYEIRIKSSGMTDETRMPPTYLLTAGPNDNPPYKAYELVAPPEKFSKIEKSPGPGGTTKLRPDEDDKLRHFFKILGAGRYYGYDVMLVEEGLDQWGLIEKALGAKIMEIDDAMELGYTDVDPEDSSGIIYLGNQKNEGYSAGASGGAGLGEEQAPMFTPEDRMVNANDPMSDGWRIYKAQPSGILEGILKEYDTKTIDQVVERLPKGLTVNNFTIPAFKEYLYNKYYAAEKPNWKQLVGHFAQEYRQKHGIKEYKLGDLNHFDNMLLALPKGLSAEQINLQGFKEFIYEKHGDKEWLNFKKNRFVYWDAYEKAGKTQEKKKFLGLFDEEEQIDELKCWPGYTRVSGVPAGAPGSCKKKTKESSIIKGIQSEEQVDEYKEVPSQRKITFSKENPPDLYYLYQQFVQRMLNPDNKIDPKDWIEKVNSHYGLNYTWKDYQKRGHNDQTDNWQKIVNRYIVGGK